MEFGVEDLDQSICEDNAYEYGGGCQCGTDEKQRFWGDIFLKYLKKLEIKEKLIAFKTACPVTCTEFISTKGDTCMATKGYRRFTTDIFC